MSENCFKIINCALNTKGKMNSATDHTDYMDKKKMNNVSYLCYLCSF